MAKANTTSRTSTTRAPSGETHRLPADLIERLARADRFAVENVAEWGGFEYINPMLGHTVSETFGNIADVMQLMHEVIGPKNDLSEIQHGLKKLAQIVWVTAQYESHRLDKLEGGAA